MRRRFIALTVICIAAGAATNLAIAWWCSWRAEGQQLASKSGRGLEVYAVRFADGVATITGVVGVHRWRGVTYVSCVQRDPNDLNSRIAGGLRQLESSWMSSPIREALRLAPLREKQGVLGPLVVGDRLTVVGAGWPLPSFWCVGKPKLTVDMAAFAGLSDWPGPGLENVISNGLSVSRGYRRADSPGALTQPQGLVVPLPYRPLWTGLIVNTLLFSLPWLIGFAILPRAVRRFWKRRGHCNECGYDLKGLAPGAPCPECGQHAVPSA